MLKTDVRYGRSAALARASPATVVIALLALGACHPDEPSSPSQSTQEAIAPAVPEADRELQVGRDITLQRLRSLPGDSSESYRRLWVQHILNMTTDQHGPDAIRNLPYAMIVNGTPTSDLRAVGALLVISQDSELPWLRCSGILTGHKQFVTARHCLASADPGDLRVYLQHEGILKVSSVTRFCETCGQGCDCGRDDLAIVVLENRPLTVQPMSPTTVNAALTSGPSHQIAGYGAYDTMEGATSVLEYAGIKHRAEGIEVDECPATTPPAEAERTICFPIHPISEGMPAPCYSDSGGPMLPIMTDAIWQPILVGVIRKSGTSCEIGHAKSVRIAYPLLHDWLTTNLPAPESPSHEINAVEEFEGEVSMQGSVEEHLFQVPAGIDVLLVTLNHATQFSNQDINRFNLSLVAPDGSRRCAAMPGVFTECRVAHPEGGGWKLRIASVRGTGLYQLTALAMALKPRVPGPPSNLDAGVD